MPVGLRFHRKHRFLGYKLKYFYYFFARRDIIQKKKSYGNDNSDKVIYIIKPDYQDGVEGLLSLIYRQVMYVDYAKGKGYVPFVDWKNYKTQYYDGKNNVWNWFFKQPSNIDEVEVYSSKNVYLSGWTFKDLNSLGLFSAEIFHKKELLKASHELLINNLTFCDEVNEIVKKEAQLLDIDNCIGVYIRGTDYVKLRPSGEYIQPDVKMIKQQISSFLNNYHSPVFLVTEDGDIYDELVEQYGKTIKIVSYDTFIRNYNGKDVLSRSNVLEKDKKMRGQKYLAKMILLSKCKYFISSITQGSKFSYSLNGGKYTAEYVFDLGLYP
ncbi:MAG: hypothetical protein E7232_10030 [Lachnospiraceae bacterium]|jgi:hypothetical protein|nr:hypothetical protein [Lachnospiraceae bacterium]